MHFVQFAKFTITDGIMVTKRAFLSVTINICKLFMKSLNKTVDGVRISEIVSLKVCGFDGIDYTAMIKIRIKQR